MALSKVLGCNSLIKTSGRDSRQSLGLKGDPTSPSYRRSVLVFIGRTEVETETPILWPLAAKR